MKPIIGITAGDSESGDVFLRKQYCEAVSEAGGVPVVLHYTADPIRTADFCDGIIFSGGGDVSPEICPYTDFDPAFLFEPCPERDRFEVDLVRLAYEKQIPCLGICRGMQVMNFALGGSLTFDIPGHKQTTPRQMPSHRVSTSTGSLLSRLLDVRELEVNSFHHQSVNTVGEGLTVSARADDGTIEAVEAPSKRFFLGVQWHPEHMICRCAEMLFEELCRAAGK